ncbi:Ig-like domain-containing protein, partial [Cognatazoarcus halotolerans]|uniref:Ig-like domain-containing protein n=1 Tax=Cognatazoarcus halotolerans TaxID=2686016 RepID=UPI00190F4617
SDAPIAQDDVATTAEDTPVIIDVLGNDSDPDGDTLTITEVGGQPISVGNPVTIPEGSVALNPDGTLTFTPNPNFNGPVSFDYTVTDGTTPVTATVDVTVT